MAPPAVRKSGRVRSGKKSLLADDFEYDETKFEGDDSFTEEVSRFEVDISSNISNLLQSHCKEQREGPVKLNITSSYSNVASTMNMRRGKDISNTENDNETSSPYLVDTSALVCPLCDKLVSTEEELTLHVMEHQANGNSQPLSCDICDKILADVASYTRHIKCHSGDRPFQCGQCDKTFLDSCSLKRHLKTHEEDRPFSCDICLKTFRDSGSISRHMLIHTDRPRLFQCSVCDKNFTDKTGLKRHERTHSGVRPYLCGVCNKSFIDSCSFKRHQKIHIGIKNHHCTNCKKSFMEKQSLIRHQKTACRYQETAQPDGLPDMEDDSPSAHGCHIGDLSGEYFEDKSQDFVSDKDILESSNSSFPGAHTPISLSGLQTPSGSEIIHEITSPVKSSPSLSSLIRKDPKLYEGITEIVDSIDSYEKMLDLCGDGAQEEIDAVLQRESTPMPDSMLCFECGELLIDGVNFKSEEKNFHPSMNNAFKCLSCEEEEDEDDYGEPPVLMPHYVSEGDPATEDLSEVPEEDDVYLNGVELSMDNHKQFDSADASITDNGNRIFSHPVSSDSEHSKTPVIETFISAMQDHVSISHGEIFVSDCSLSPVNDMKQSDSLSSDLPRMEYEADDPSIPSVFPCHLCTKVFASSSFLAQHLELHRKSPFKCMVCGKTFTSGPALKRHMRLHTGEKPYSCSVCLKQFRDPSNFSKHKKNCPSSTSMSSFDEVTALNSLGNEEKAGKVINEPRTVVSKRKRKSAKRLEAYETISHEKELIVHSLEDQHDSTELIKMEEIELHEVHSSIMAVVPSWDDEMADQSLHNHHGGSEEEGAVLVVSNGESPTTMNYIPCEICQKLCESEQHLEMHMNYHQGNPDVSCIECGKSFADAFGLKRHMRLHTGVRPYVCDYCGRGYCDNWSLKKHRSKGCVNVEVQLESASLIPCSMCNRIFCDKAYLQEHVKLHKGEMKYECDVCKKGFSEAFNLKKHRRLHMAICSGCGQEFQNMKLLTDHQNNECTASLPAKDEAEDAKSFSCDVCGRSYSTKAYLERHRKIHLEIKPFICEICNKRFSEAFKLRRHKKASHSDLKPFVCLDCGKCFSDDPALRRHQVSSSCALSKVMGEPVSSESCVCQICNKEFQKNYMLVRHMTVHSQDRPFSCDVCGRTYKDTSSLKRHQMIHQGIKDFVCSVCGKGFYYADSLKRHASGRCGKKSKVRKRRAAAKKGKKKAGISKFSSDRNIDPNEHTSKSQNGGLKVSLNSHEAWKDKLLTKAYKPFLITEQFPMECKFVMKKSPKGGRWSCVSKKHCWLCDVKASSNSIMTAHRRIHQHKQRFSCRKCFSRFKSKVYWKAHHFSCHIMKDPHQVSLIKLKKKRSSVNFPEPPTPSVVCVGEIPVAKVEEESERRRPRRSIPRAQWSWISQI